MPTLYEVKKPVVDMEIALNRLPTKERARFADSRINLEIVSPHLPPDDWGKPKYKEFPNLVAFCFTVRLHYQGRVLETRYQMGLGHDKPPKPGDVLNCLILDASGVDQPFEDWASDLGYDPDSRKAEAVYRACQDTRYKLRDLLGEPAFDFLCDPYSTAIPLPFAFLGNRDFDDSEEACEAVGGVTFKPARQMKLCEMMLGEPRAKIQMG